MFAHRSGGSTQIWGDIITEGGLKNGSGSFMNCGVKGGRPGSTRSGKVLGTESE